MIEYRSASGSVAADAATLDGLVTPFNTPTVIGDLSRDGFREQIAPGAFAKTLQERDVVLLVNHNTDMPLARTSVSKGPGSLSLREDPEAGLRAVSEPVSTSYGQDLMALARAQVVKGMSFGFEVIKDEWTDGEGRASDSRNGVNRTIREVRLHEVSAVTFPAYPTTTLAARDSIDAARGVVEERADTEPEPEEAEDADHAQCLASVDAVVDEALGLLDSCDRNELQPEVNQAIDLLHGAGELIDAAMKSKSIPDPDEPNGAEYGDTDEGERSEPVQATPEIDADTLRAYYRAAYGV